MRDNIPTQALKSYDLFQQNVDEFFNDELSDDEFDVYNYFSDDEISDYEYNRDEYVVEELERRTYQQDQQFALANVEQIVLQEEISLEAKTAFEEILALKETIDTVSVCSPRSEQKLSVVGEVDWALQTTENFQDSQNNHGHTYVAIGGMAREHLGIQVLPSQIMWKYIADIILSVSVTGDVFPFTIFNDFKFSSCGGQLCLASADRPEDQLLSYVPISGSGKFDGQVLLITKASIDSAQGIGENVWFMGNTVISQILQFITQHNRDFKVLPIVAIQVIHRVPLLIASQYSIYWQYIINAVFLDDIIDDTFPFRIFYDVITLSPGILQHALAGVQSPDGKKLLILYRSAIKPLNMQMSKIVWIADKIKRMQIGIACYKGEMLLIFTNCPIDSVETAEAIEYVADLLSLNLKYVSTDTHSFKDNS